MRFALIACVGLLVAAAMATLARYGSLDPCDWMEQDLIERNDLLPPVMVKARIRIGFLLDGITDPGPDDCLVKWWEWRGEGLPEEN